MKTDTFDFKAERLFPIPYLLVGFMFLIVGLVALINLHLWAFLLIAPGVFVLTARRGVDFDRMSYREYDSFFYLKSGKWKKYSSVEKLCVNSSKVSQKISTMLTNNSTTYQNIEYDAYLKLEGEDKIYLVSEMGKDKLLKKLSSLAHFFQLRITDNT